MAGNVLGSDHLSLTKRTLGEEDKRGIGAARNADKFVEPSLGRGPQGAKGGRRAKGHLTRGGAASSAKSNQ